MPLTPDDMQTSSQIATPPPTPVFRSFLDNDAQRDFTQQAVLDALSQRQFENANYTLRLADVQVKPRKFGNRDEKEAVGNKGYLHQPIHGRWELVDKASGNVVDKKDGLVAYLPHMTNRGTYVVRGTNYVINHQTRLRPGVYTRKQRNGLIESQFNVAPKSGRGFRIRLDPATGKFKMRIGQGESDLYPLLLAAGVDQEQLRAAWGDKLYKANEGEDRNRANLKKSLSRLGVDVDALKDSEIEQVTAETINRMQVDPEVMEMTSGVAAGNLSPALLLATTRKMLDVSRGDHDGDDRDSIAFQTVHGPEDFMAERINKDAGSIGRKLLWNATRDGNLKRVKPGAYRDAIYSLFNGTGLAQAVEDTNPMEIADLRLKLSRMGEGALRSTEAAPRDARGVQPSHYGFIDGIRTPECHDEQTEVMTSEGWVSWKDVTSDTKFACLIDGNLEYHMADRLIKEPYKGIMYGAKTSVLDYLVTPNHEMWVRPRRKTAHYRKETAETVHGNRRMHMCAGHTALEGTLTSFHLPQTDVTSNAVKNVDEIDIGDWCEFLGWYISEGSINGTVTRISQVKRVNPINCARIEWLLDRLPFTWHYAESDGDYKLSVKQLSEYCAQFGKCDNKYIPAYVFEAPAEARQRFVDAALAGDGRSDRKGRKYGYCTTSEQLALDFHKLLFELGVSSRITFEPDDREERYLGCWVVQIHSRTVREVTHKNHRHPFGQYYKQEYDGVVYCATVPGGLLYTRRNQSCGFWSGNSDKIGLDMRVAHNTFKGKDNKLYTAVLNKAGKTEIVSATQMLKGNIGFAGEHDSEKPTVRAMVNGKMREVPRSQVDYWIKDPEETLAPTSNLVPFISASKAQRALMGARMTTQALPLVEREAPLVQSAIPGQDSSFDQMLGESAGAVRATDHGTVTRVGRDSITIRTANGEKKVIDLYDELPMNRLTNLNQAALVKAGDTVTPGQVLANSNFTDNEGAVALGRNLRVGYLAHSGATFEDAVVISESAAAKLAAETSLKFDREKSESMHSVEKDSFRSLFPATFSKEQLDAMDENGVVKKGTVVHPGDPLLLQVDKAKRQGVGAIMRSQKAKFKDESQVWEHNYPGQVVDVFGKGSNAKVVVRSILPAKEGDKLSGRFGDKGVISKIIPDDQMPQTRDGNALEILVSPTGLNSRGNASQVIEAALGKIAEKRGKKFLARGFRGKGQESFVQWALDELKEAGISDTDDLVDPTDGRSIKEVFTGNRYYMRLHHLAEKKLSARDTDEYTADDTPAKGGKAGAKRISLGETAALLSAGATEVLRDAKLVRGQRNDDYWRAIQLGYNPAMPTTSVSSKKFLEQLRAAGVNVVGRGNNTYIMPATDASTDELAKGRTITSGDTFNWDTMEPIKGGLFDVGATGGTDGTQWSAFKLPQPVLNPIMQEPVQKLLGLSEKKLRDVLAGREALFGATGPGAVKKALVDLDNRVDKEIASTKELIATGAKSKRDSAVKRLAYLTSFQKMGFKPSQALITKVPVLPPKYRPISKVDSLTLVADPNYLYADMIGSADNLSESESVFGKDSVGDAYLDMYDSVKAVVGLGDPVSKKLQDKKVRGILAQAVGIGRSPKSAQFQRRIVGSAVDQVGRAVIAPDPKLDIDQIGVPEEMAWTQYRKYIVRKLVQRGMPATQAVKSVIDRTGPAERALHEVMDERPVFINRAPTLHRHSLIGGRPVLIKGDAIKLAPAVEGGLGADHDGDAVQLHVPSTDEAVEEVYEKLMPSRNLRSPATFDVHMFPENEFVAGIHEANDVNREKRARVFRSEAEAVAAYMRGEISVRDPITIAKA